MITVDSIVIFAQANPIKSGIVGYGSIHLLFRWSYTLLGKLLKAIYNHSKRLFSSKPTIPQDGANSLSENTDSLSLANPLFNQPVDLLSKEELKIPTSGPVGAALINPATFLSIDLLSLFPAQATTEIDGVYPTIQASR